ncbi:MAG: hypothetical protein ACYCZV_06685 [Acidimicrobiales bacterium]
MGKVGDHATDLAGESEAYLVGQLAAWLDHHGRRVPEWAWVNALSRSGLDDLVAVDRLTWRSRRSRTWAKTFLQPLAADLALNCRGSDQTLAQLQRRFLWPLEARMAAGRGPFGTDPGQLAAIVRTALGSGDGRSAARSGGYPPPPVGRGLGHGRINRIALSILGPASVARRPGSGPPKTPNS